MTADGARRAGPPRGDRVLLACGAAAGPLFVSTFLVLGAVRRDYDPLRHPVSSLALGRGGWMQRLNFGLNGALYLALAAGLARTHGEGGTPRLGPVLIGASGVGQITAGVFTTDPVGGYPVGTPAAPQSYSGAGALLHDLGAVPVFLGIPAAVLLWARGFRRDGRSGWARYSAVTAGVMLAGFALTSAAFAQVPALVPVGGLLQRLTASAGLGWLTALSLHALATTPCRGGRPRRPR